MSLTDVAEGQSFNGDGPETVPIVDISKPRWDQSTFLGRLQHFAAITDVRKVFASNRKLDEAKDLVQSVRYCLSSFISTCISTRQLI